MAKKKAPHFDVQFDSLVKNAVDFLDRSVQELSEGDFKYSAMHFFQSVELFVKARLVLEHWSLVAHDPAKADRKKFEKGDFQSVGLHQAIDRLKAIAGEDISPIAKAFEPVRQRRNRAIHFHAPEYPPRDIYKLPKKKPYRDLVDVPAEVSSLVAEQCLAWFELHLLLTKRWRKPFSAFSADIDRLNRMMLRVRPYLKTRFEKLRPEIAKLKKSGVIAACSACGFQSSKDTEVFSGLVDAHCIVCQKTDRTWTFACPQDDCEGHVHVDTSGSGGDCDKCEHDMSIDDLVKHFDGAKAYCSYCESTEVSGGTVVHIEDAGSYLCLNCLEDGNGISDCEWCNESILGDTEDSYLGGCVICEGRMGHGGDD